jgi:hypothetical protein
MLVGDKSYYRSVAFAVRWLALVEIGGFSGSEDSLLLCGVRQWGSTSAIFGMGNHRAQILGLTLRNVVDLGDRGLTVGCNFW